jgi:hypothetical protein
LAARRQAAPGTPPPGPPPPALPPPAAVCGRSVQAAAAAGATALLLQPEWRQGCTKPVQDLMGQPAPPPDEAQLGRLRGQPGRQGWVPEPSRQVRRAWRRPPATPPGLPPSQPRAAPPPLALPSFCNKSWVSQVMADNSWPLLPSFVHHILLAPCLTQSFPLPTDPSGPLPPFLLPLQARFLPLNPQPLRPARGMQRRRTGGWAAWLAS